MEEHRIEMPNLEECIICYEENVRFMTFPCNHKACSICFPKLRQCPLCQTEIQRQEVQVQREPEIEEKYETCKLCFSILAITSFCIWCLHITHTI